MDNHVYLARPYLSQLDEFISYVRGIWEKKLLTSVKPFHQQLEQALCDYLDVKYLALFTNGTTKRVTARQSSRIKGKAIYNTAHAFEGDVIVCADSTPKQHIDHLKNFGFVDDLRLIAPGINGRVSEVAQVRSSGGVLTPQAHAALCMVGLNFLSIVDCNRALPSACNLHATPELQHIHRPVSSTQRRHHCRLGSIANRLSRGEKLPAGPLSQKCRTTWSTIGCVEHGTHGRHGVHLKCRLSLRLVTDLQTGGDTNGVRHDFGVARRHAEAQIGGHVQHTVRADKHVTAEVLDSKSGRSPT